MKRKGKKRDLVPHSKKCEILDEDAYYGSAVTWMPFTINGQQMSIQDLNKKIPGNPFMNFTLPKGNYSIDYVINLIKIILEKAGRFPSQEFHFTLTNSLQRLLANLEVEKDQLRKL